MVDPIRALPARYFAGAALALWLPIAAGFTFSPGARWIDYLGIFMHLAMFMLVARLEAPDWAKAAGYGWILLDITAGVFRLNGVPDSIALFVRLSGHLFAGIWLFTASLQGSWPTRIIGGLTGTWLASYTIVAAFVPIAALGPASILTAVWMALIVWNDGPGARPLKGQK